MGNVEGLEFVDEQIDFDAGVDEKVASVELGLVGDSRRALVVVGVPEDDPGHGCPVAVVVDRVVVGARVGDVVEPVVELPVVNVHTVIVDPDGHALSRQPVLLPDINDVDHLVHPVASVVEGILRKSIVDARVGGVSEQRAHVIELALACRDLVAGVVQVGIEAGSIPRTVIATLCVEAPVTVGLELVAYL